jgi:hypothetical protein
MCIKLKMVDTGYVSNYPVKNKAEIFSLAD